MANNVKFKLDHKGVRELLRGKEMQKLMNEKGKQVLNHCPDIGYGMHVAVTDQRAQATVGTRSVYSERENNKHNTLLKALG